MKNDGSKPCWLAALLLVTQVGWAQPVLPFPDSVARYLRPAPDTTAVNALNTFAWNLAVGSAFARADSVLNLTEKLARRLHHNRGLVQVSFNRGLVLYFQDNYTDALIYLDRARRLADQCQLPPEEKHQLFSLAGHTHYCLHNYNAALPLFLGAIQLTERYSLTDRVTPSYIGIGNVLRVMGRNREAHLYFRKALVVARREKQKRFLALALTHMGVFISGQGKHRSAEALTYFQHALPVARQVKSRKIWADDLTLIGQMYLNLGRYKTALTYLREADQLCAQDGFIDQLGANCYILGLTHQALKHAAQAEAYLKRSLQLARQIHEADGMLTRTKALAQFYEQTGQYRQAYQYQRAAVALKDSLFLIESARHAHELVTRYETEKKEQQLRLLSEKNERATLQRNALLLIGVLGLLLVASVVTWLLNRARLRRLEEAQQLRQQIAHDLHDDMGSTLSSISLLSSMTNTLLAQPETAGQTPDLVQQMVAKIYADTRQVQETVDEFIWLVKPGNDSFTQIATRIRAYAQPLLASRQIGFQFVFDPALASRPVSMDVQRNLYLLSKEAVHNVLKHAQATEVTIRFDYCREQLWVRIDDNGRGFDPDQATDRTGQESMAQRAKAMKGRLTVQSAPAEGTSLELTIAV